MVKVLIPVAVAAVAIIVLSTTQGVFTERNDLFFPLGEDRSEERDIYEDRLNHLPMNFGDWIGTDSDRELEDRVRDVAGIEGRISRIYRNAKTHEQVSVEIVSGHPYRVAAHTPDRCYVANGYVMPKDDRAYAVKMNSGIEGNFRHAKFRKEHAEGGTSHLHIFWSWRTAETDWVGPTATWARIELAGNPAVYKIYIIDRNPARDQTTSESPIVSFIEEVVPQIDDYLSGKLSNVDEAAVDDAADGETTDGAADE